MKLRTKVLISILSCISVLFAVPEIDKPAPDFTLYNYDTGDSTTLSDFRGKRVVLLISGDTC